MKAVYKFQFGYITIEYEDEVLLSLICTEKAANIPSERSVISDFSNKVFEQIQEYLQGTRKKFDVNYKLSGTEFQLSVWRELLKIPYGETRTYKEIAQAIGNEGAARAVGVANNRNPLHIIIPCHRVIGTDGSLTGYAGGIRMKEELLKLEKKCLTTEIKNDKVFVNKIPMRE
ncbi:MAG: methylated-DNA--[protein]-cysteine S-methyltransferase [Lachnospiraceae bacterium]